MSGDAFLATSVLAVQDWAAIFAVDGVKGAIVRGNDALTRDQLDAIKPRVDAQADAIYGVFLTLPADGTVLANFNALRDRVGTTHWGHPRFFVNVDCEGVRGVEGWNALAGMILDDLGPTHLGIYAGGPNVGVTATDAPNFVKAAQFHRPAFNLIPDDEVNLPAFMGDGKGRVWRQACCGGNVGSPPCHLGPFPKPAPNNSGCVSRFSTVLSGRSYAEWFEETFVGTRAISAMEGDDVPLDPKFQAFLDSVTADTADAEEAATIGAHLRGHEKGMVISRDDGERPASNAPFQRAGFDQMEQTKAVP